MVLSRELDDYFVMRLAWGADNSVAVLSVHVDQDCCKGGHHDDDDDVITS